MHRFCATGTVLLWGGDGLCDMRLMMMRDTVHTTVVLIVNRVPCTLLWNKRKSTSTVS